MITILLDRILHTQYTSDKPVGNRVDIYKHGVRNRPFNLKGGGGYGFLFRSEIFFRTTQELEYLFFLSRKARIFFPEFNIRLYDKNSESDYFFLHQNQNIFFSNIGNQNIFLEKNHNPLPPPPFKLNGRSLTSASYMDVMFFKLSEWVIIVWCQRSNFKTIWWREQVMRW